MSPCDLSKTKRDWEPCRTPPQTLGAEVYLCDLRFTAKRGGPGPQGQTRINILNWKALNFNQTVKSTSSPVKPPGSLEVIWIGISAACFLLPKLGARLRCGWQHQQSVESIRQKKEKSLKNGARVLIVA